MHFWLNSVLASAQAFFSWNWGKPACSRYSIFLLTFVGISPVVGQQLRDGGTRYSIGAQYTHEFVIDGFVRVREWEVEGDKMKLKDLGMNDYPALQLNFKRHFQKNRSIEIAYNQYFMSGSATFDRNISYNGTLIDGRSGIDVSPTRYYRLSAMFRGELPGSTQLGLRYMAGLLYDHVTFYLDGEVRPESTRNEVYERFGKQALPYPVVGFGAGYDFGTANKINVELCGIYIPEFRSFYNEGGRIYLQYTAFQTDVSYSRMVSDWEFMAGAKMRYMHLFQESEEDTNVLRTLTAGPFMGLSFHF